MIDHDLMEQITSDMLRKDFEVFRVQDNLMNIFNDCDIFSDSKDEFLSIDHSLDLGAMLSGHKNSYHFKDVVVDAVLSVAFNGLKKGCNAVEYYNESANRIAKLILKSCKEKSPLESIIEFQLGFTNCFPHLSVESFNKEIMQTA